MDDYYLNMSNNLKKASYEDVDPSCLNLTSNSFLPPSSSF